MAAGWTVDITDQSLSPTRWDAVVSVISPPTATHEPLRLAGRVVGPRCRYATTVEVAYPLPPLPGLSARIIVPEPSLWTPETPFLYRIHLMVTRDGEPCFAGTLDHGPRRLELRPNGFVLNGLPYPVRAVSCTSLSESEALVWRKAGINALLVPVESESVWGLADQLGFLVFGRWSSLEGAETRAARLQRHASCAGWLMPGDLMAAFMSSGDPLGQEIGASDEPLAPGAEFVVVDEGQDWTGLPRVVRVDGPLTPGSA